MQKLLFTLLLLAYLQSYAQQADTTYYSKPGMSCAADTAHYYRVTEKLEGAQMITEYFLPTQQLKRQGMEVMDTRRMLMIQDGPWNFYHKNGNPQMEAIYTMGVKTGTSKTWYENGQRKAVWKHEDGQTYLQEYWGEAGKEMVAKGEGWYESFYPNKQMREQGAIKSGKQHGAWKAWHNNGQLMHSATLAESLQVGKEEIWTDKGQKIYEKVHAAPGGESQVTFWKITGEPLHKIADTKQPLQINWLSMGDVEPQPLNIDNIRLAIGYPEQARQMGFEGKLLVQVMIDKAGKVENVKWIKTVHPILKEAVSLHVDKLKFSPAIIHGRYSRVTVHIPFNFKLVDGGDERKEKKRRRG